MNAHSVVFLVAVVGGFTKGNQNETRGLRCDSNDIDRSGSSGSLAGMTMNGAIQ